MFRVYYGVLCASSNPQTESPVSREGKAASIIQGGRISGSISSNVRRNLRKFLQV